MNYKVVKRALTIVALTVFFLGCIPDKTVNSSIENIESIVERPKIITGISFADNAKSFNISIQGNVSLTYSSVKQPFPLGIVLYFPETELENIKDSYPLDNNIISDVLTVKGHTSKIVILLKKDISYKVTRQDAEIIVFVEKEVDVSHAVSPKLQKKKSCKIDVKPLKEVILSSPLIKIKPIKEVASSKPSAVAIHAKPPPIASNKSLTIESHTKPTTTHIEPVATHAKPTWIDKIDFTSEDSGKSTIAIGTIIPVRYETKKITSKTLHIEFFNTNLANYRKRPLITTRFRSAVDLIVPVQTSEMKNKSIIVVELREAVPYTVEQKDNVVLVHFEASSISPKPIEQYKLPSRKKIISQTVSKEEKQEEISKKIEDKIGEKKPKIETQRKYSGKKITMDYFEADLKNVFRLLGEISEKNFVVDNDVKGTLTLTLDKPVPWDQALDLILKINKLGMTYEGDIIRIATIGTIQQEEKILRDKIREEQMAQSQQKELEPLLTEYISVSYAKAADMVKHLKDITTKKRGVISLDDRTNTIIITDVAETVKRAKQIIRKLDKVTPQVIIEARIVEASVQFSKALGIEWGAQGGIQADDAQAGIGPQRGYDTVGGTYGYDLAMNFPVASAASLGLNFKRLLGTPFLLNAKLMAMESSGDGKIISAPKILTLDNKQATITQGYQYPYLSKDESGNTTTAFKNIDLKLDVTPHITPDDRIAISLNVSKNDIYVVTDDGPAITKKEAKTELLINDGDTIVIGGIIKTIVTSSEKGVPIISKIPFLGWLFKNKIKEEDKQELLIFITPRIVRLEQRESNELTIN